MSSSLRTTVPSWPLLLFALWATVAGVRIARLLHGQFRLHRLLRGRREVTDQTVLAMLAQLRRNAGIWRLVRLSATPRCSTPFALGSAEICVPEQFFENLPRDEQRCAIAHELAHLARRDPLWQFVAGLVDAVLFFQPLNRLAQNRLRETAEHLSDDWAVRQTGSALGLARCLASVATWVAPGAEPVPQATMAMAEGGSPLLRRVERLLQHSVAPVPPAVHVRSLAAVGLLVAAVGTAPGVMPRDPVAEAASAAVLPATAPPPAAPAVPDRSERFARAAVPSSRDADRIRRAPNPALSLATRYAWSVAEAHRRGDDEYWVGYAFQSTFIRTGKPYSTDSEGWTLSTAGVPPGDPVTFSRARDPGRPPAAREVVVLLRVRVDPDGAIALTRVTGRTPDRAVDLEGLPVYWLDAADDAASVALLASLERHAAEAEVRETLVDLVALHRDASHVVPVLLTVLAGDDVTMVRGAAAEGLGWHPSPAVTERLLHTALTDRSIEVQDEAVEALEESGVAEAVSALETIVRSETALESRVEAVEALGAFRRPDILGKLVDIALSPLDRKIQSEAVETIAHLGLSEAAPVLERIARVHPSPAVRSEALEWLAQTGQPPSLETLFELALGDPEPRIQRKATEHLVEFRLADAVPLIRRVAWEHDSSAIRRQAAQIIGALPPVVGLPLLDEIVAHHPDDSVVWQAVAAIGSSADEQRMARLRQIAQTHPSPVIRRQALDLLPTEALMDSLIPDYRR